MRYLYEQRLLPSGDFYLIDFNQDLGNSRLIFLQNNSLSEFMEKAENHQGTALEWDDFFERYKRMLLLLLQSS